MHTLPMQLVKHEGEADLLRALLSLTLILPLIIICLATQLGLSLEMIKKDLLLAGIGNLTGVLMFDSIGFSATVWTRSCTKSRVQLSGY